MSLIALGLAPLLAFTELWQLHLLWGLIVGVGTGATASVLGAAIAQRWFQRHRGTVIGLFGASVAAGQLLLLPTLVSLTEIAGWRSAIALITIIAGLLLIPVVLLMRNRPEEVNALPFGAENDAPLSATQQVADNRKTPLAEAVRTRDFWLLAGSFFICGYTTNGLIGTHLLLHAVEHGFDVVATAGALSVMGGMNLIGALASGWLSDRYDNRKLLAIYYGFRALSLVALPFIVEMQGLFLFAILYGLDWVATVPPTANLTAQRFGRGSVGTIYGWIFCSHMIGAGIAAYAGGFFRDQLGDYHLIFISAALMGFIAVGLSMRITRQERPQPLPAQAN